MNNFFIEDVELKYEDSCNDAFNVKSSIKDYSVEIEDVGHGFIFGNNKEGRKKEALEYFELMDADGDGGICLDEMKECLEKLGIEITDEEISDSFQYVDTDGDGKIDKDEFYAVMVKLDEKDAKMLLSATC